MLPRFADIFQQGNRWLNWLEKQPEGSVRPVTAPNQKAPYWSTSVPSAGHR
ncbi:transposase [Escherichia coli]|nr:transposase [Escherichia coli]STN32126.1 transposase [Escherichia coli]